MRPGKEGLPTTVYRMEEEIEGDGKEIQTVFKHVPNSIGALEAEEVGVEHLLRDINDPSVSTLASLIKHKISALSGLKERLEEIEKYLVLVSEGKIQPSNQIVYNLQDVFNLLPNLNVEELVKSMIIKTNDMHLVIYVGALIRSVIALHNLLVNKARFSALDEKEQKDAEMAETAPTPEVEDSSETTASPMDVLQPEGGGSNP